MKSGWEKPHKRRQRTEIATLFLLGRVDGLFLGIYIGSVIKSDCFP
jgi:hypothetical protein